MDITNLITQDTSNEGKWFQLVLYGQKQPVDIKILGEDSDVVQGYQRRKFRKIKGAYKNGSSDIADIDNDTLDELLDSVDEDVIVRMNGLRSHIEVGQKEEPLTLDGIELKSNKDSYSLLLRKIPAIKEFILNKSKERTNFLSDKKSN